MTTENGPVMEGPQLHQIADRVLNRPLMIHPDKAAIILQVLSGRIPISGVAAPAGPLADRFRGSHQREDGWGMSRVENGVAIIPIIGSLVNRGAWIGSHSGMTSYEGLGAQIREARSDPEVRAIVLDIDSPGGEATGMMRLADDIRAASAEMPVIAVVNDMAASAAYGLASAAREIVVSRTSIVGSIGVVWVHSDHSGQLDKAGIAVTIIHAGAHKVDGHPFGPLSKDVAASFQAEINEFYDLFIETVVEGRGSRLSAEAARATEARVFLGNEAITLGLADKIGSLDEVLAGLSADLTSTPPGSASSYGEKTMTDKNAPAPEAGITQAALDAATATARDEGFKAGTAAERTRVAAILGCDEAKGRERQAAKIATTTDMTADQAKAFLSDAPMEATGGAGKIKSVEERAAEADAIGEDDAPKGGSEDVAAKVWGNVVNRLNK